MTFVWRVGEGVRGGAGRGGGGRRQGGGGGGLAASCELGEAALRVMKLV